MIQYINETTKPQKSSLYEIRSNSSKICGAWPLAFEHILSAVFPDRNLEKIALNFINAFGLLFGIKK